MSNKLTSNGSKILAFPIFDILIESADTIDLSESIAGRVDNCS